MNGLSLHPPAKINLTLRVGPVRNDGFHDVQTIMQTIALSDRLTIIPRRGPLTLSVDSDAVPSNRTNLIWRAAEQLWSAAGRSGVPHGVAIKLAKTIPVSAGLGGGSADAAATLAGLNRIWRTKLSREDLLALAAEIGSDVPFFLIGGTALGLGRGTDVYPLEDISRLTLILVKPALGVSAAEAYQWFDEDAGRFSRVQGRPLEVGWPGGPLPLVNDLEPPVVRRHPDIKDVAEALSAAGASAVSMSGSGSAVFAVVAKAPAARLVAEFERAGRQVIVTRTLSRREAARRVGLC